MCLKILGFKSRLKNWVQCLPALQEFKAVPENSAESKSQNKIRRLGIYSEVQKVGGHLPSIPQVLGLVPCTKQLQQHPSPVLTEESVSFVSCPPPHACLEGRGLASTTAILESPQLQTPALQPDNCDLTEPVTFPTSGHKSSCRTLLRGHNRADDSLLQEKWALAKHCSVSPHPASVPHHRRRSPGGHTGGQAYPTKRVPLVRALLSLLISQEHYTTDMENTHYLPPNSPLLLLLFFFLIQKTKSVSPLRPNVFPASRLTAHGYIRTVGYSFECPAAFSSPQNPPKHSFIQHSRTVLCMPWRYNRKQDMHYKVLPAQILHGGAGRQEGLLRS